MAMIPQKLKENKPNTASDVIPPGWYPLMIISSEVKQTKAGTGEYLLLTQVVADGEYKGHTIWNMINWINPNPKAEEIAHKQWANLLEALEIGSDDEFEDTEMLHGEIIEGLIIIQKSKDPAYDDKNVVKRWRKFDSKIAEEI